MRWRSVDSPVIVPPFCGRARALDVITMEGASDGNLYRARKEANIGQKKEEMGAIQGLAKMRALRTNSGRKGKNKQ